VTRKTVVPPAQLLAAIADIYVPAGMAVTHEPSCEAEGADYGACRFALDGRTMVFRVAKTTPTKLGQFVTLWKRPAPESEIAPLDRADDIGRVIVDVADDSHQGQFVIDPAALIAHGVMSNGGQGGKRAIRVYPPWVSPIAKDAIASQKWQTRYFLDLTGTIDRNAVRRLFG